MRSQISSSSSFSELKAKCFESGLKSLMTSMSPNAQNEILQITALKVLCGIASDIAESGYYSIMADAKGGQGDYCTARNIRSDASRVD